MATDDELLEERVQLVFAAMALQIQAESGGARAGTAMSVEAYETSLGRIPDPRVLCPLYRQNKDQVCQWLRKRLGPVPGMVLCGVLDSLCG